MDFMLFQGCHSSQSSPSCLLSSSSDCNTLHSVQSTPHSLSPNSQFTWHLRLGHPNPNTLHLVLKQCNISINNKSVSEFCAAYCMGKGHHLYAPPSITHYITPLELVYSDLWGPALVSSSTNHLYYITFVDATTRFTWIYLIKSKSDSLSIFKEFKAMVELQLGLPLKSLQTDWGGEFRLFI